jgi:transposase
MIALPPGVRVYLACGITDMRKGMVGLAMLVQQGLAEDPFNGALYLLVAGFRPGRFHR